MASPQTENGFTRIANELLEAFTLGGFSRRELVVLLRILRVTYGYGQKVAHVSARQVAEATGLDESAVRKTLKSLIDAQVIAVTDDGIGIQKDFEKWVKLTCSDGSKRPGRQVKTTRQAGQNDPEKQVNLTRATRPKSAQDAESQAPKEKKESIKENHDGDHDSAPAFTFTPDELSKLAGAVKGLACRPEDLTKRIRSHLASLIEKHKNPPSLLEEFDRLDRPVKLAWYCQAMAIAKGKHPQEPSAWVAFAAGAIRRHLMGGSDILEEKAAILDFAKAQEARDSGPYAGKPWARWFAPEVAGGDTDETVLRQRADRVAHFHGKEACDWQHAVRLYREHGTVVAAEYVWGCQQAARGGNATA